VTTGSSDGQSGPAASAGTAGPVAGAADGTQPTPGAEISDTECRLRVARADRARSSAPPPEFNGSNERHASANKAEFEKRKMCGACFACLNSKVKYDVFHLDCPQHGSRATPKQRTEKAFCVPGTIPRKYF
jgi:hypothetical protein